MTTEHRTAYQVLKELQGTIDDEVLRHTALGLILISEPISYEETLRVKRIDEDYIRNMALRISEELDELNSDNIEEKIQGYIKVIDGVKNITTRRKRRGHDDLYKRALSFVRTIRTGKKEDMREKYQKLGRIIEEGLPSLYRNHGFGNGDELNKRRVRKALKQEYLYCCRMVMRS